MIEKWIPIKGYEDRYLVSNTGKVRSTKELKSFNNNNYLIVSLSKNGKAKKFLLHNLVISSFLGEREHNKIEINHKNSNKLDNSLQNLEYVTSKQNKEHCKDRMPRGEKQGLSKLKELDVLRIRSLYNNKINNVYELASRFNVSSTTIRSIINNKTWVHI